MMIFDQILQIPTRHNLSYVEKEFTEIWTKRAYFDSEISLREVL